VLINSSDHKVANCNPSSVQQIQDVLVLLTTSPSSPFSSPIKVPLSFCPFRAENGIRGSTYLTEMFSHADLLTQRSRQLILDGPRSADNSDPRRNFVTP
jgi:hypothetical protein